MSQQGHHEEYHVFLLFQTGLQLGYRRLVGERVNMQQRKNKAAKNKFEVFFQSTDVKMKIMIDRCARHHQAILRLKYFGCWLQPNYRNQVLKS